MPDIEENKFQCDNARCGFVSWASYHEDACFLPMADCPVCHKGKVLDTDETRIVNRPLKLRRA